MSLDKATIPLKFSVGVDTSTDPKIQGQALLRAENAVFPKKGSIGKRRGTKPLPGTYTEQFLTTYQDRPVALEHSIKMARGGDITGGTLAEVSTMALWNVLLERTAVPEGEQRFNAEVIEVGDVRVWAYAVYNTVSLAYDLHLETYDKEGGQLLDSTIITNPSAGNNPQCRLVQLDAALYYMYVSLTAIHLGEVNVTTGVIAAAANTGANGFANNQPIDAVAVNTESILAAGKDSTGNNLQVADLRPATTTYTVAAKAGVNVAAVGIWQRQADEAVVGFYLVTARELHFLAFDTALNTTVADTTITTVGATATVHNITGVSQIADTANMFYTLWENPVGVVNPWPRIYRAVLDLPGPSVTSDAVILHKAEVASRPLDDFADSGSMFLWAVYDNGRYAYLIDETGLPVGKALPAQIQGSSSGAPLATYFVPTMVDGQTALRYRPDTGSTRAPVAVTIARPTSLLCIEAQDTLQIPNSIPYSFDGETCVESGYLLVMEQLAASVAGGGNLSAGDYRGVIVPEWRDRFNRLHRGSPSVPSAIVVSGGAATFTWTIPYLCHTRRDDVVLVFYRTNADGSRYYRHPRGEFANNKGLDQFTFVDGSVAADDDLSGEPELYITGGVYGNIQPPGTAIQAEHQSRQFVADTEQSATKIRYSKTFVEGIAIEHASLLYLTVPPAGGDITALLAFMGRLLVMKESGIYAVGGKGLNAAGGGQGYSTPLLVSEARGCVRQRTIVVVPGGVMFLAEDRIWLLDKSFRVQPIGDPVRYWTDPRTTRPGGVLSIKSAVHLPKQSVVVFLSDAQALIYNYLYGAWATWVNHEASDGTEAGGLLFFKAGAADSVVVQDEATFEDNGTPVQLSIETGWLAFAKALGVQRIYRVLVYGDKLSDHMFHLKQAYNGEPYWSHSRQLDVSSLTSYGEAAQMGDGTTDYEYQAMVLQARTQSGKQKSGAIRLRVYDTAQAGSMESFLITALGFEVGIKPTARRVGASRRLVSP